MFEQFFLIKLFGMFQISQKLVDCTYRNVNYFLKHAAFEGGNK